MLVTTEFIQKNKGDKNKNGNEKRQNKKIDDEKDGTGDTLGMRHMGDGFLCHGDTPLFSVQMED